MYFNGKLNKLKSTRTHTHHDFKGNFKTTSQEPVPFQCCAVI